MCETVQGQIQQAARDAKNLLGQLGPLAWALHVMRQPTGAFAVCVDREPEKYVEIQTGEDEPGRGKRKQRVVDVLQRLRECRSEGQTELFESVGYRATINRSIVVYAVAVLEQFLDKAGGRLWTDLSGKTRKSDACKRKSEWAVSFGGMVDALERVRVCLYCPKRCPHYSDAALFALYRHKIVHADAKVDKKLVKQVADIEKKAGRRLGFCLSEDGSSVVWKTCGGQKLRACWKDKDLSLAIDEVILPLLRDAQQFVAEAEIVLLEAAGKVAECCP